ncbi:phage terminase large subunit family protein, partial [Escherichia coli]|uniref:phage terminase large subunit family protein n=1 Tax=Escherichia coli TaxID=562 RepID=UPI00201A3D76
MGFSSARNLGRDISAGFSPPRRMPISEAVKKFMRVPKGAGNSVPWDPELTPYIIEPMNCLASREYDAVIFVGPARTGKTIGLIDGWIVYTIVCDPSDMLVVQMTEDKAREHSKKRLDRTFRSSAAVKKRMSPRRNDNNVHDKTFRDGSFLKIGWPSVNIMSSSDSAAKTSETNAKASETSAESSKTAAASSASSAASSASSASASKDEATRQASAAKGSATTASTKATEAAGSATAAAQSKSTAESAATRAETAAKRAEDIASAVALEDASTTKKGIVQLSSATNSTSETLAATPKAVKSAYDNAEKRLQKDQNGADIPDKGRFLNNINAVSKTDFADKRGMRYVRVNAPAGATSGKYYPVVVMRSAGSVSELASRVIITTATRTAGDPMNNCEFNGFVMPGGWTDRGRYAYGMFWQYQNNERAIHSIMMSNKGDDLRSVFYVDGAAFPVFAFIEDGLSISAPGADLVVNDTTYKFGATNP